ncbi:MAG: universal stress protein [Cyclobacteriaceae bacterium]
MKTILLPTDFSSSAHNAIKYALSLWADEPVRFVLLNAYYLLHSSHEMLISVEDILRDNSIRMLQKELMFIDNQTADQPVEIETLSRRGEPIEVIKKVIIERAVDTVVMGTKGASGLKEKLIGSNTAQIISKTRCPVIIVPDGVNYHQPKKIAFAAKMGKQEGLDGIEPLVTISRKHQSQVLVLNVASPREQLNKEQIWQRLSFNGHLKELEYSFHMVEDNRVIHGINDFIKSNKVDLLVVVPGQDNLVHRLFHPSVSKGLALHSKIPLLVL